jgi:ATP-dependent Lhr-like helicase
LLTTLESSEVMLVSGNGRHKWPFVSVRAMVVEKVHAFAADDRSWHLLALLRRIGRLYTLSTRVPLVSMTTDSSRPGQVVRPESLVAGGSGDRVGLRWRHGQRLQVIDTLHRGEKRLVFCDSRSGVEQVGAALRSRGVEAFVAHSLLNVDERRTAERAFAVGRDCVIVATSALDLGIVIGDRDRVIQVDAPVSVSSFLQRMGRTRRRHSAWRNCPFLATTDEGLLRAAGLVRLWAHGCIEAIHPPTPAHILAQQVMALALPERGIALISHPPSYYRHTTGITGFPRNPTRTYVDARKGLRGTVDRRKMLRCNAWGTIRNKDNSRLLTGLFQVRVLVGELDGSLMLDAS